MKLNGVEILVTKLWIEDVLKKRVVEQGIPIEKLFVITRAQGKEHDGDDVLDTQFGKLRIFWRADLRPGSVAVVCHVDKFPYPAKGNTLTLPDTNAALIQRPSPYDRNGDLVH